MRCAGCGCLNPADAKYCEQCGARLLRSCPHCGHEVGPDARFCRECGTALNDAFPAPESANPASEAVFAPIQYTPPHLAARIRAEQAALAARHGTEGERKTITVLFADLAGSTELVHDLDPEEARRLIDPVLALMMEAVHHYEGYVAKSMGDGILALFGAPIGCEEHAQRALFAALRMQEAMRYYGSEVQLSDMKSLQIRVGVHTGEVVVRAIRSEDLHTDYDPVGQTINIASRLEGIAAPGSVLATDPTCRLAEGFFRFKTLGAKTFKGVPEPMVVHEVVDAGPLRTRFQVAASRGLAHFVGRREEQVRLSAALAQASAGCGQVVGVVGDPGVGKSRLFHQFKHSLQPPCQVMETFSVSHGKAFPYLPLIELLKQYLQILPQDNESLRHEKITGKVLALDRRLEDILPYLLYLFGIADGASSLSQMDLNIRRQRTFEAIRQLLIQESLLQPLVLLFEDLQWLDRETAAFLDFFADGIAGTRILLLINFRPEYRHEWGRHSCYTELRLDPLGQVESALLLDTLLGSDASLAPLKPMIMSQTEGNPFFIEEVVQTLLEEKVLSGMPGHRRLEQMPETLHIPTTVQGVLTTRIDRLAKAEKELLQVLAVIGKAFSWRLIGRLVDRPDEELHRLMSCLQSGEFIYGQPSALEDEYRFKHGLTQEVAYASLLRERREALHERTGQAIEALFGQHPDDHYGDLAFHYSRSGNVSKAVEYLYKAGLQSVQRSANQEAVASLDSALELLQRLPAGSERDHRELEIQVVLGPALMAVRGIGSLEVEQTYKRALELCRQLGETTQLFPVLVGLRRFYTLRTDFSTARELAEQLLRIAASEPETEHQLQAHFAIAAVQFFQGQLAAARQQFEHCIALFDPHIHPPHAHSYSLEPGIQARNFLAWICWYQGYPKQALEQISRATNAARESTSPHVLADTLIFRAELHQLRRELTAVRELAEAVIALSTEHGLPFWLGRGTILLGRAMAAQDEHRKGIARIREGLQIYATSGALMLRPYYLSLLAEALGLAGKISAAQGILAEAASLAQTSGERYYLAEILRLQGDMALRTTARDAEVVLRAAESLYLRAVDEADQQGALALKLRATASLAKLWSRQGRVAEACRSLRDNISLFSEGLDTKDLQDAKALLEQIRCGGEESDFR